MQWTVTHGFLQVTNKKEQQCNCFALIQHFQVCISCSSWLFCMGHLNKTKLSCSCDYLFLQSGLCAGGVETDLGPHSFQANTLLQSHIQSPFLLSSSRMVFVTIIKFLCMWVGRKRPPPGETHLWVGGEEICVHVYVEAIGQPWGSLLKPPPSFFFKDRVSNWTGAH